MDLGRLNRLATIRLSQIRRSTPTTGLEVILGLKPIVLVIGEAGLLAYWRWDPKLKWLGRGGSNKEVGQVLPWARLMAILEAEKATLNRKSFQVNRHAPWYLASKFDADNFHTICEIDT